jgi:hypothetical protein
MLLDWPLIDAVAATIVAETKTFLSERLDGFDGLQFDEVLMQ